MVVVENGSVGDLFFFLQLSIWRDTNVQVYEYSVHVTWHSAFSEGGRAYFIGMHGRIALRGGDTTST